MDLRIERTRKNIINAFISLRSKKAIENITVKELSELADINILSKLSQNCFSLADISSSPICFHVK